MTDASDLLRIADALRCAYEIGDRLPNQNRMNHGFSREDKDLMEQTMREAAARAQCSPDSVEAWQWLGESLKQGDPDWVAECTEPTWSPICLTGFTGGMTVWTCRGKQSAKPNDWIVRIEGDVYIFTDAAWKLLRAPAKQESVAMLGGIHGVALTRHIKGMQPAAQAEYHTPLYAAPQPLAPAQGSPNPADEIIGQIEERFPDWKGFRDLVDCIDVTLHRLRGGR